MGKREGEYNTYYENGNIKEKGYYINGLIEGEYNTYYENGNIYIRCLYKNGKIKNIIEYDYNGNILKIFKY